MLSRIRQTIKYLLTDTLCINSKYLVINTAVVSLSGFLFWIVVTRYYAAQEVGYSSAILSLSSFLSSIAILGFDMAIVYFLPKFIDKSKLINTCMLLILLLSVIVSIIYIITINFWSPSLSFIRDHFVFSITFVGLTVLITLAQFVGSSFIADQKSVFVLIKNTIFSVVKILFVIVLANIFLTFGVVASVGLAYFISLSVAVVIFFPRIWTGYKFFFVMDTHIVKSILGYSFWNYIVSLLYSLPATLFPIMVLNMLGPESNAYFYIVWGIASAIMSLSLCVSLPLFAEITNTNDVKKSLQKAIKLCGFVFLPVVVVVIFSKSVLSVFGSNYTGSDSITLLYILSASSVPFYIVQIYVSVLRARNRIAEMLGIFGISALLILSIGYIFIKSYGIVGIGMSWLLVYIVFCIYAILRIRKILMV